MNELEALKEVNSYKPRPLPKSWRKRKDWKYRPCSDCCHSDCRTFAGFTDCIKCGQSCGAHPKSKCPEKGDK